jgi:hypothetical protein
MIYLHQPDLCDLLGEIEQLVPDVAPELVRLGVCPEAVSSIAATCAEQAVEALIESDVAVEHVVRTTYLCGLMLGLKAAERIGR